jgi:hypothetical protein
VRRRDLAAERAQPEQGRPHAFGQVDDGTPGAAAGREPDAPLAERSPRRRQPALAAKQHEVRAGARASEPEVVGLGAIGDLDRLGLTGELEAHPHRKRRCRARVGRQALTRRPRIAARVRHARRGRPRTAAQEGLDLRRAPRSRR